jgi:hypothetical protein
MSSTDPGALAGAFISEFAARRAEREAAEANNVPTTKLEEKPAEVEVAEAPAAPAEPEAAPAEPAEPEAPKE